MKDLHTFDAYRCDSQDAMRAMGVDPDNYDKSRNGCFLIEVDGVRLTVIAARGGGWDHVSVSAKDRCPTWTELEAVARMFFKEHEAAMQLHVPEKDHINHHPFVLHWWRSRLKPIPLPPKSYV